MIRTERLLLRRWRDDDRQPFAAMNQDPLVMEHFPGLTSPEDSNAFVDRIEAHFDAHGWGLWALEVPGIAPFVGFTGLWPADAVFGEPTVEVGWRSARERWGHGYVTEAALAALRVGFEELGLEEIVSFTVPQNERSLRVMERIGLIHDPGRDFDHPRIDPVRYPHLVRHVLYRLDRARWEESLASNRRVPPGTGVVAGERPAQQNLPREHLAGRPFTPAPSAPSPRTRRRRQRRP